MTIRPLRLLPLLALLAACSADSKSGGPSIDEQLADLLATANVSPLPALTMPTPAMFTLGQALMFDKELSGNRNISCATCHHPLESTTDHRALSVGEGATGRGPLRGGGGATIPRHAPDVFNRGYPQWGTMFWDARVAAAQGGGFNTPAGAMFPTGVNSVLAAQSLFPITSREEMRGQSGDPGNELATVLDADFTGIWDAIMNRLRAIPKYDTLFLAAYSISVNAAGIQHVANAIAAFETDAWTRADTPYDAYVAGNLDALTQQQKRGARLFFGEAQCSKCHLGPLLTDQKFHNIAIPQLGPGKTVPGLDYGRELQSGLAADRYAFRTPPLRNVALTAPYMHNGAYATLKAAVKHYVNVTTSLQTYDASQLPASLQGTVQTSPAVHTEILATVSSIVAPPLNITDNEVDDIVAFLNALTDPAAVDLSNEVPASVPSGIPID